MTYMVRVPVKKDNDRVVFVMFAQLSNQAALKIISSAKGHFRPYRTEEYEKTVFEVDEDCSYGSEVLKIFLDKGTILIPSS